MRIGGHALRGSESTPRGLGTVDWLGKKRSPIAHAVCVVEDASLRELFFLLPQHGSVLNSWRTDMRPTGKLVISQQDIQAMWYVWASEHCQTAKAQRDMKLGRDGCQTKAHPLRAPIRWHLRARTYDIHREFLHASRT
jgi:hypothetical protein